MLFDTNVARRFALIHFLGIERRPAACGSMESGWCHRVRDTLAAELADHPPFAVPLGVSGVDGSPGAPLARSRFSPRRGALHRARRPGASGGTATIGLCVR
jgi:hypothetical protein